VEQARPEYSLRVTVNDRALNRVVIDQHYRENHADSVNDELILRLVRELDGKTFPIELTRGEFQYFTAAPVQYADKPYRLVLVLCVSDDYLGVINAFRISL
jgi:hypothetical protein